MSGGGASSRILIQNIRLLDPPLQETVETLPSRLGALTATELNAPLQPANATPKDAHLSRVTRDGAVLVIGQHNLPKPETNRRPEFLARALDDYLRMIQIRHIYCLLYHPQTSEPPGRPIAITNLTTSKTRRPTALH